VGPYKPPSKSFTVLVVEDEFLIAIDIRERLEAGGYEVIGPVATVAAALAILEGQLPHACVLDVNLRGEHSAPVARVLKEQRVPFLLSSAHTQEMLDQYPAFEGVTNIGKPVSSKKLLSMLASLLKT
jgi:CheY-like chemotaxis protein